VIRVLLLADTHLGFDLPSRPRVDRRRRGPDFFANTRRALGPALAGELSPGSERVLRAEALRTLHPPSMTVVVRL